MYLKVMLIICSVIAGVGLFLTTATDQVFFGFRFNEVEVPVWHALAAYAATFFGVIFSLFIFDYGEAVVRITWQRFGESFLSYSTPGSLMVASIVYVYGFNAIYSSIGDWIAYFTAFQSGFFFKQSIQALTQNNQKEVQTEPT